MTPLMQIFIVVLVVTLAVTLDKALADRKDPPPRDWVGIVIHHTASPDVSARTIDKWHRRRGFDTIGYHFVIRENGTIEEGRPLHTIGAHAKASPGVPYTRNPTHIGVCLTGYDKFTPDQLEALSTLIVVLIHQFPIQSIEPHHEECPGPGIDTTAFDMVMWDNIKQYYKINNYTPPTLKIKRYDHESGN